MKFRILFILLIYSSRAAFAQSTPQIVGYFDAVWGRASQDKAVYYRTVEPAGDKYLVKDYYKSGQLQMEAVCTAYEPKLIWKGITKLYHENGAISEEGMFENEDRIGAHTYWYKNGIKKKEVIHVGKESFIAQFWSPAGEPLLIKGNGTVRESDDPRAVYMNVQDSVVVATFDVHNGIDSVYSMIPQQPEYKGGLSAMMRDIKIRLRYPENSRRMGIEGRVFVGFIVDKQGRVKEAAVLKGVSRDCDTESVRVVSTLNRWVPGRWQGKAVNVRFVLPINFALR